MKNQPAKWHERVKLAGLTTALLGGVAMTAPACLDREIEVQDPRTTTTIVEKLAQSAVDKIDLLLVIDNSGSMADKQAILISAVPDLVDQLVNPVCLDENGAVVGMPATPLDDCVQGKREFPPILDMHIGIISSSLGDGGAGDLCANQIPKNDEGRLLSRTMGGMAATYQGIGFLAWDPAQDSHTPPGEANQATLNATLSDMVGGVGETGCGFEAPLEAWYRFLVDPDPYASINIVENVAQLDGVDQEVLNQRAAFLRPDSLLAIIMLTDENDCSGKAGGVFWNLGRATPLPRPTPICATNPDDPCCTSCGVPAPAGCTHPSECFVNGDPQAGPVFLSTANLTGDDQINARCFNQKQRFGIDFLYPTSRYSAALRSPEIANRAGEMVPNPIFSDLNLNDDNSAIRDSGLVFLAGITGVPWQLIARQDANGQPDLLAGLDVDGNPVGGYMDGNELAQNGVWPVILGDLAARIPPSDPHMIESQGIRGNTGVYNGGPSNPAGDYQTSGKDLQYACIFPLQTNVPCSAANTSTCDCSASSNVNDDKPLCDTNDPLLQTHAKAYPGLRQLDVLKAMAGQGITGSVCPAQQNNMGASDFGYRPAVQAIVDRLKTVLGGQCLARSFVPDPDTGQVSCLIVEASNIGAGGDCNAACNAPGRRPVSNAAAVEGIKEDPAAAAAGWNCFCEIVQAEGDALTQCQQSATEPNGVDGWCYIDASVEPAVGNPVIVAQCPATERRLIRFAGAANPVTGSTTFTICSGEQAN